jgi:hypothetical protein
MFGSGHNSNVPGNPGIRELGPWARGSLAQPLAQAMLWGIGIALVTLMMRRESHRQQLTMFAFYVVCALAFMAKGVLGFALPGLVAFFHLLACGRFPLLFAGKLRVAAGALTRAGSTRTRARARSSCWSTSGSTVSSGCSVSARSTRCPRSAITTSSCWLKPCSSLRAPGLRPGICSLRRWPARRLHWQAAVALSPGHRFGARFGRQRSERWSRKTATFGSRCRFLG